MEQNKLKYRGNKISLGGVDYSVPALSVGQAAAFDEQITEIGKKGADPDQANLKLIAEWIPIFLPAFQRNYPEMEAKFLEDNIDLNNFAEVREAVLGYRKETATLGE